MSIVNIISTFIKEPYNPIGLPQQEANFIHDLIGAVGSIQDGKK